MGIANVLLKTEEKIKQGAEAVGIKNEQLDKIVSYGGWVVLGYLALKIINSNLNSKKEKGASNE